MTAKLDYAWKLREVMATRGLFQTTHLRPRLAERGGRLRPRQIEERFAACRDALKLPAELVPHCLRHSHVICTASDPVRDIGSAA